MARKRLVEAVVAVAARHLLDEVDLAGHIVAAEARHGEARGAPRAGPAPRSRCAGAARWTCSSPMRSPRTRAPDRPGARPRALVRRRVHVDPLIRHGAAGHGLDELHHAVQGARSHLLDVHAPLEPVARVGGQAERPGRGPDGAGIEVGALDEEVGGPGPTSEPGAAHDAGHGHGLRAIGDDQHVRRQSPVHVVQRGDALAGAGPPDADGRPASRSRSKACRGWPSSWST
jgi:hypothetical protein